MDPFLLPEALEMRRALVVHFSHHANMRPDGVFPTDLMDAIKNRGVWPLSCCVLWPGHQMDLPGSVGIIFAPLLDNVLSVSASDSGSHSLPDGSDASAGVRLSAETFEETFYPPICGYNEWRVQGAGVVGIFVSDPSDIQVKQRRKMSSGPVEIEDIFATPVGLDYVFQSFPDHDVYTLGPDGLVRLSRP